jgi:hypothetical protein
MTRRAVLSVVVGVASALALATPTLAAAPSSWGKSASAICAGYSAKIDKLPQPKTPQELVTGTKKILAYGIAQLADISKLDRPAAQKAEIGTYLGIYVQQVAVVKRLVVALQAGDQAKANAVYAEGTAINKKMDALVKKLGAARCAG